MNYTYMLRCGDGSFYTGWTNDIKKRLQQHRSGKGAKYTKGRGPLTLVYLETFDEKTQAMKREAQIKQLKRKEKEILIENDKWRELLQELDISDSEMEEYKKSDGI